MYSGSKSWFGKPYYSLDAYCKSSFGHKCQKIALNAHMTCPNRDGTLGSAGCIFCSAGGSGDFAVSIAGKSVEEQLAEGLLMFRRKHSASHFIAYFQAYTNTYAPVEYLERIYAQALLCPDVCGISIATRPDCLPDKVLLLLKKLRERFPDKFIWIELGLQTIHESTAIFIRRGYPLSCFDEALEKLRSASIPVIIHLILGLPYETDGQMLQTIDYINEKQPFGVKLQLLHVLKGTDLAPLYLSGSFSLPEKEEYLELTAKCLSFLCPHIVIHRLTGDGPKESLIAPGWSLNKRDVLNSLHRLMKEKELWQGKYFSGGKQIASGAPYSV